MYRAVDRFGRTLHFMLSKRRGRLQPQAGRWPGTVL
ncbi:hypothetical protein ABSY17_02860 (plasmid) [Mesorhizobium sp. ANAO-SY3R2]